MAKDNTYRFGKRLIVNMIDFSGGATGTSPSCVFTDRQATFCTVPYREPSVFLCDYMKY